MKKWTKQQIVEVIGLLGVIGSLIFVGFEIRQNSIATRASANDSFASSFQQSNLAIATSPELAKVFSLYGGNPDKAPTDAQIQMRAFYRTLFHIWSNGHRQYLNGTLDSALFDSVVQEISTYADNGSKESSVLQTRQSLMRWVWETDRYVYNPDFQAFVDDILDGGEASLDQQSRK